MLYAIKNFMLGSEVWTADTPVLLRPAGTDKVALTPLSGGNSTDHAFATLLKARDRHGNDALYLHAFLQASDFLVVNGRPVEHEGRMPLGAFNRIVFGRVAEASLPAVCLEFDVFVHRTLARSVQALIAACLLLVVVGLTWSSSRVMEYNAWVRKSMVAAQRDSIQMAYACIDSARQVERSLGILRAGLNSHEKTQTKLDAQFKASMYAIAVRGECPNDLNPEYLRYVKQTKEDSLLFRFTCGHEEVLENMTTNFLNDATEGVLKRFHALDATLQADRVPKKVKPGPKGAEYDLSLVINDYFQRSRRLEKLTAKKAELAPSLRSAGERLRLLEQMIRETFNTQDGGSPDVRDHYSDFIEAYERWLQQIVARGGFDERESQQAANLNQLIHHFKTIPQ